MHAFRKIALSVLPQAMEAVVLVLVCASPWAFGAVEPGFESLLFGGVALLLLLWAARILLAWRLTWYKCPALVCLAALFVLGVIQVTPLSRPLLSRLSPATTVLYDQLLPSTPEILPNGEAKEPVSPAAGSTISLYPGGTRRELVRLLALLVVFAVVRSNFATREAMWRFSIAALLNGVALAFFSLAQFPGSPSSQLYWTFQSHGQPFGPFVCRNHFPFYLNMCIGLAVGLLLCPRDGRSSHGGHRLEECGLPWYAALNRPQTVWICAAVGLMAGSVLLSLSRGGCVALVCGLVVFLLLKHMRRSLALAGTGIAVALAFGLVGWLGSEAVENRLATLWAGDALRSDRLPLWSRVWPLAFDFPFWGTGYGTFVFVEPLRRELATDTGSFFSHAHNEYLELLVEGGLVGLVIGLLGFGFVFRSGLRTLSHGVGRRSKALTLGGLFALVTLAVHSFGDFGLHIPAIALFATVLCAHICGLSDTENVTRVQRGAPEATRYRHRQGTFAISFHGFVPLLAAALALVLAGILVAEGRKADQVQRLRYLAYRSDAAASQPAHQVELLQLASRIAPDYARLHVDLAQAHLRCYQDEPVDDHLTAALWAWLQARDLCPLMAVPHARLAAHGQHLKKGEPPTAHLKRAKFLAPGDAELWYHCGLQELLSGDPVRACRSWQHSLELSESHLRSILDAATKRFDTQTLIDCVLPDRPALFLSVAELLFPNDRSNRRPFAEKALAILQSRSTSLTPEELQIEGRALNELDRKTEALTSLRAAVEQAPEDILPRYNLALMLFEAGKLREARQELVIILTLKPGHEQASALRKTVERRIAETF